MISLMHQPSYHFQFADLAPPSREPEIPPPAHTQPKAMGRHALPPSAYATLGGGASGSEPLRICRVVAGLSGAAAAEAGAAAGDEQATAREMAALAARGFGTFDARGARSGAEDCAGEFRSLMGRSSVEELAAVLAHVAAPPGESSHGLRRELGARVDGVLARLRADRVDLLQIHWAGGMGGEGRFLEVLGALGELRAKGKVRCVGAVNFPTTALAKADAAGLSLDSNQVAYSLLDRRPGVSMADWCEAHGVALLATGATGAGFLGDRYIGVPEPTRKACVTPGLASFARVIRAWGGWSLFQELLFVLKAISEKYGVSVGNVAVRWVLEQTAVAAAVVGAGLGRGPEVEAFAENGSVFGFALDDDDRRLIDEVASRANDLFQVLGDVGAELEAPIRET